MGYLDSATATVRADNNGIPGDIIFSGAWTFMDSSSWENLHKFEIGNLIEGTYWICSEFSENLVLNIIPSYWGHTDVEYHSDGSWRTITGIDLGLGFYYDIEETDPNHIGSGRIDVLAAINTV